MPAKGSTTTRSTTTRSAPTRSPNPGRASREEAAPEPLPQCWQDVTDALAAGIDRLILFGPPGTGKTYAGLTIGGVERGAHRLV